MLGAGGEQDWAGVTDQALPGRWWDTAELCGAESGCVVVRCEADQLCGKEGRMSSGRRTAFFYLLLFIEMIYCVIAVQGGSPLWTCILKGRAVWVGGRLACPSNLAEKPGLGQEERAWTAAAAFCGQEQAELWERMKLWCVVSSFPRPCFSQFVCSLIYVLWVVIWCLLWMNHRFWDVSCARGGMLNDQ